MIGQISPNEIIAYEKNKELSILKLAHSLKITWLKTKNSFSKDELFNLLSPFFDPNHLKELKYQSARFNWAYSGISSEK